MGVSLGRVGAGSDAIAVAGRAGGLRRRAGTAGRTLLGILTTAVVLGLGGVAAAGPAEHFEFSVAGEKLADCPSGTYTITEGSIAVTFHQEGPDIDPSEQPDDESVHFVMSVRPVDVVLENEGGEPFRLVGADKMSGSYTPNPGWVITTTHKMSIVSSGGGIVERFNTVVRLREDRFIMLELGSCPWQ